MAHVTLRQLQVFEQVAEALSFARVAERLHLTPSAVSFQIRQIEEQTGLALFERIGRKVALTEAGTVLLQYARPALQSTRDLDDAMQALKGGEVGRVRLGLVSTAKYIVPHMIARFRREKPGVTVFLREGNRSFMKALLAAGDVDLAVTGQPAEDADVNAERFAPHPSVIIARPGHPLSGGPVIAPERIVEEWFILREQGSGTRGLSDRFFADCGAKPRVAMETSSNEMIKQAVMAGMGLALLSQHTIRLERSLGLLDVLPVAGFPVMRSWFVVKRRTSPLLPGQASLRKFLVEHGQSIITELEEMPRSG
ncbi:MAG: LysR family transcriptional regulator [Acetobacteraceae bacterium]|nr:LysR family transcriptional regulator [Acetobacteraceae bacterium]